MSNSTKITSKAQLSQVIFKDYAEASVGRKFFSLFPGLGYAAGYKVRMVVDYLGNGRVLIRSYRSCKGSTSTEANLL